MHDSTMRLLQVLRNVAGQALAVISGREIEVVDRLLHPLVLPVAGVHGLQRRDALHRLSARVVIEHVDPTIDECMQMFLQSLFVVATADGVELRLGSRKVLASGQEWACAKHSYIGAS